MTVKKIITFLIFILIVHTSFSQESYTFRYISKTAIKYEDKNELSKLDSIESKLLDRIKKIKEEKQLSKDIHVYAAGRYMGDWMVPLIPGEIPLFDNRFRKTNNYELSIVWDNTIDTGFVLGFSRIYNHDNQTSPRVTIPLRHYKHFLSEYQLKKLNDIVLGSLIKKYNLTKFSDDKYIFKAGCLIDTGETFPQTPDRLLIRQITRGFLTGTLTPYVDIGLTHPITKREVESLPMLGEEITIKSFETIEHWRFIHGEINSSYAHGYQQFSIHRSFAVIGLVLSNKTTVYFDPKELKPILDNAKISWELFYEKFKACSLKEIGVHYIK